MKKYAVAACAIAMCSCVHASTLPYSDARSEFFSCVAQSAVYFKIHPRIILSIADVEGGKNGSYVKNKNGTHDMGIMQINTIHLPEIQQEYPQITESRIVNDTCVNVYLSAKILYKKMKGKYSFWEGVGNYHSKTPHIREKYLNKLFAAYKKRMDYERKGGDLWH